MTEERLRLHEKAEVRINAIIDTLSQDKGGLADKLKQEDVKDFLISLWVDCSTEVTEELQNGNFVLTVNEIIEGKDKKIAELEKENAELRAIAENQQSSNMERYFENKKLKEGLAVGSMWNKHLNSQNKALEEERDRYRNMTFDQREQLTKAKDHIKKLLDCLKQDTNDPQTNYYVCQYMDKAEQFLKDSEEK